MLKCAMGSCFERVALELKELLKTAKLSTQRQLAIPKDLMEQFHIKDRELMGFFKDDKGRLVIMVANPSPM